MADSLIVLNGVRSDALAEQSAWVARRDGLLTVAAGLIEVGTDQALDLAGGLLADAKKCIAALEKVRKEITVPIDACKKVIMDQEKAMVAPLQRQADRIQGLANKYATDKAAAAEAARLKAQREAAEAQYRADQEAAAAVAAHQKAEEEAKARRDRAAALFGEEAAVTMVPVPVYVEPPPAPEPPRPAAPLPQAPKAEGSRMRVRWDFTVTDPTLVPREYLSVDDAKVRAGCDFMVKMEREPAIPGVQFTKRVSVESSGR